jgi:hypothetical protein
VPVEFDGKNNAMFHSHNKDGELQIEYVRDHGHYPDIPLDKIHNAQAHAYEAEVAERLKMGETESHKPTS